jgi:ferritin-like metal-binding protein YciE
MADDWADPYLTLLDDCESRESRLSDWEREFVSALRSQIDKGRHPTPKQIEMLDKVWEKATKGG